MPVTLLPRTGMPNWSAGADPLTRAQMDAMTAQLEAVMALDAQGTLAARPAAGIRGRYYYATDNGFLYRDTGAVWATIGAVFGGGAPPAIADAGAEGVATTSARSDHTHALHAQTMRLDTAQNVAGVKTFQARTITAGRLKAIVSKNANYNVAQTDEVILVDASGGARTMTLPAAAGKDGQIYEIKKIDSSANAVIIDGNGAETVDGAASVSITTQWGSYTVVALGGAWYIV